MESIITFSGSQSFFNKSQNITLCREKESEREEEVGLEVYETRSSTKFIHRQSEGEV